MRFLRCFGYRPKSIDIDKLYAHIVDDELSEEGHRRLGHSIVSDWIDCATRGLCENARERIRKEIEAHYEESVCEHIENGDTLKEAHQAAIHALGSPDNARRVYRKTYLTTQEQFLIGQLNWSPKMPAFALYVCSLYVWSLLFWYMLWKSTDSRVPGDTALLTTAGLGLATGIIFDAVARRHICPTKSLRWSVGGFLVSLVFMAMCNFIFVVAQYFSSAITFASFTPQENAFFITQSMCLVICCSVPMYTHYRILRKLRYEHVELVD